MSKIGAARGNLPEYKHEQYMNDGNACQSIAPMQMSLDKAALLTDYNQLISLKCVQVLLAYIVKKGMDAKHLTTKGYGFSEPIAEK